eukprot:2117740-Karenia_brevis.AAC.1
MTWALPEEFWKTQFDKYQAGRVMQSDLGAVERPQFRTRTNRQDSYVSIESKHAHSHVLMDDE